ncbi:hypothetical protein T12_6664 [Trichinella patagoniensis]|uniref:Uncharacterized protein n=1 Tax=Trichinella patagoniensis TaxID=990121 RepID=A0A0V0YU96_9BILA|nr:hypothetical protein T12_6664 [Trichinella patagoniensis]
MVVHGNSCQIPCSLITKFKCNLKCNIKQISYIISAAFDAELFTNALVGFVQMLK